MIPRYWHNSTTGINLWLNSSSNQTGNWVRPMMNSSNQHSPFSQTSAIRSTSLCTMQCKCRICCISVSWTYVLVVRQSLIFNSAFLRAAKTRTTIVIRIFSKIKLRFIIFQLYLTKTIWRIFRFEDEIPMRDISIYFFWIPCSIVTGVFNLAPPGHTQALVNLNQDKLTATMEF